MIELPPPRNVHSMSISYFIDAQQECVFIALSGDVTEWDAGVRLQELWEDPLYKPHFVRLVDATGLRGASWPPSFLRAVARDFSRQKAGKVAFVTSSDPVHAMFTMYREQLEGTECRV